MNIIPTWYGKYTLIRILIMSATCIIMGCYLTVTGIMDARFFANPQINLSEVSVVVEEGMYVALSEYRVAAVLESTDQNRVCFLIEYREEEYVFVFEDKGSTAYDYLCISADRNGRIEEKAYVIEGRTVEINDKVYSKAINNLKKSQYMNIDPDSINRIEIDQVYNYSVFSIIFGIIALCVSISSFIYSLLRLKRLRNESE